MNDSAAFRRRWSVDTVRRMPAMERQVTKVHRLGPRVMLELLLEVACAGNCLPDVAERLESYASLTPEVIWLVGAGQMIPHRPLLVKSGH